MISGASSLGLEAAWARALRIIFGSTALSISTVLVTYMLGLAAGSRLGAWISNATRNPIAWYGAAEIGVGVFALSSSAIVSAISKYLQPSLGSFSFIEASAIRFLACAIFFVIPTLLMGLTFPLAVAANRSYRHSEPGRVGSLYSANTFGGVLGVGLATFFLFRIVGLAHSIQIFGVLSCFLGTVLVLAGQFKSFAVRDSAETEYARAVQLPIKRATRGLYPPVLLIFTTYGFVGLIALALEVLIARLLVMVFGSSAYTFSCVLVIFLGGIAIGSYFAAKLITRSEEPERWYVIGLAFLPIGILIGLVGFQATTAILEWTFATGGTSAKSLFYATLLGSALTTTPPAIVLGALFPLAYAAARTSMQSPGWVSGRLYSWNAVGSAVGAAIGAHLLVPLFGLEGSLKVLTIFSCFLAWVTYCFLSPARAPQATIKAGIATSTLCVLLVFTTVIDKRSITAGFFYHPPTHSHRSLKRVPLAAGMTTDLLLYEDGIEGTVSVHNTRGHLDLRVNGKVDASTGDMATQVLLGHIPMILSRSPKDVLIIGMGAGVTAGSAATHQPNRLEVVELESKVVKASRYFDPFNNRPLEYPGTVVIKNDGRLQLASATSRYDVIISEPSNPWVTGAANLFTREFFNCARNRLEEGGLFMQWIQLYGMSRETFTSILAALRAEFPFVYAFRASTTDPDLHLLASPEPLALSAPIPWKALSNRSRMDLARIGIASVEDFLALLTLAPEDVDALLDANYRKENTDDNLFVELATPWHFYTSTEPVVSLLNEYSRTWAGQIGAELDPSLLARIALSNIWLRRDYSLGRLIGQESLKKARNATGLLAAAEWRLATGMGTPGQIDHLIEAALASESDNALAYFSRARWLMENGEFHEALASINRALEWDMENPNFHRLRLSALAMTQQWQEAEVELKWLQASRYYEFNPEIFGLAAEVQAKLGDLDAAISALKSYLNQYPDLWRTWQLLAMWERNVGLDEDAKVSLVNAHRARQNAAIELNERYLSKVREGNRQSAALLATEFARDFADFTLVSDGE